MAVRKAEANFLPNDASLETAIRLVLHSSTILIGVRYIHDLLIHSLIH